MHKKILYKNKLEKQYIWIFTEFSDTVEKKKKHFLTISHAVTMVKKNYLTFRV